MGDIDQLPFLLTLLDDPNPKVQAGLVEQLAAWGDALEPALEELGTELSESRRRRLDSLIREPGRAHLRDLWDDWQTIGDDTRRLEAGLGLISDYERGELNRRRSGTDELARRISELAAEYDETHSTRDAALLADFLFVQRELRGAREDEYNQPAASDLIQVIDGGPGLPITLSCVFLLVGRRLELEVDGCNCPGHFMARAIVSGRPVLVDCFSGGRLLGDSIIMTLRDSDRRALINAADLRATPEQIVARVLRNLERCYDEVGREDDSELARELHDRLIGADLFNPDDTGPDLPGGGLDLPEFGGGES